MKPHFKEIKPYIFGIHPTFHLLESKSEMIEKIFVQKGETKVFGRFKDLAEKKKMVLEEKDKRDLDEITQNQNHQGVVAFVKSLGEYESIASLKNKKFVLVLDHIEDPHNFGAILRTADQFGVEGVIIPKNRGVGLTPTVVKVSTGASFFVPIVQESSLIFVIEKLKEYGFWIYATSVEGGESLEKIDFSGKVAIILGSEGKGVSLQLENKSDYKIKIPTSPLKKGDSLNVSVATGIIVYEAYLKMNHLK